MPSRRASVGFERLEDRLLLADYSLVPLQDLAINSSTGEKPQSKVWFHDSYWWSVLADGAGTAVFRLDGTAWTRVLGLASSKYFADVKLAGDVVHVLLEKGTASKLASLEYVPGTPGTWTLWSRRSTLTSLTLGSGIETATLDLDSTGRLWVASDAATTIEVRYSDFPYSSFGAPIVVASGVTTDDISVVTTLPDSTVGVMWSNQNAQRFGFRVHVDGDPPDAWSADELADYESAENVGGGMADDHMNLAVASDGTLYAAVKTSYDTAGHTKIGLLVRRPSGAWDPMYHVDTKGSRPIVLLNEAEGRLMVAYRSGDSSGPIVFRDSSLESIAFGPRQTLIDHPSVNNVTSTKQTFTTEVVAMAADSSRIAHGVLLSMAPQSNTAPIVDAGPDQTITFPAQAILDGTVSDDGLPTPPALTTLWSVVSGPGAVAFGDPNRVDTTASFSQPGVYVLQLSASDGQLSTADQITITVTVQSATVTASFQDGVSPGGFAGTRDTRISASNPTVNYGRNSTLSANGTTDTGALVKWDLSAIPAGSTVTGATLTFNITNTTRHAYEIFALKRDWAENAATWELFTSGARWEVAGALGKNDRGSTVLAALTASALGLRTISLNADGVALVQSWIDAPASNFGLIIQNYDNSDGVGFSSRETAPPGSRPRLEVTYAPPNQGQTQASLTSATQSVSSPMATLAALAAPRSGTRPDASRSGTRSGMVSAAGDRQSVSTDSSLSSGPVAPPSEAVWSELALLVAAHEKRQSGNTRRTDPAAVDLLFGNFGNEFPEFSPSSGVSSGVRPGFSDLIPENTPAAGNPRGSNPKNRA